MNKERRKYIRNIIESLEVAKSDLEQIREEEQSAFDNMPEGLQASERGEAMEDAIYNLEDAFDSVDSAIDTLNEIIGEA
jgi:hypothetical protein